MTGFREEDRKRNGIATECPIGLLERISPAITKKGKKLI